MTTTNNNIFRRARQLLRDKPPSEMTEDELEVVKIATMPLLLLRQFSDKPIDEGLEELAKIVEEAKQKWNRTQDRSSTGRVPCAVKR